MAALMDVNEETFDAEVLQSELPVLVDFWGDGCAPCRAIAPHLEKLAAEKAGVVKIVKVNVQSNLVVANAYHVTAMPTFILYKNGQEVARQVGVFGGPVGLKKLLDTNL